MCKLAKFRRDKSTHYQDNACGMPKHSSASWFLLCILLLPNHYLIVTNHNELNSDVPYSLRTAPTVKLRQGKCLGSQRIWQRQHSGRDSAVSVELGCLVLGCFAIPGAANVQCSLIPERNIFLLKLPPSCPISELQRDYFSPSLKTPQAISQPVY